MKQQPETETTKNPAQQILFRVHSGFSMAMPALRIHIHPAALIRQ
jgi:hypothetical protein